jgi:hypothetical protein
MPRLLTINVGSSSLKAMLHCLGPKEAVDHYFKRFPAYLQQLSLEDNATWPTSRWDGSIGKTPHVAPSASPHGMVEADESASEKV